MNEVAVKIYKELLLALIPKLAEKGVDWLKSKMDKNLLAKKIEERLKTGGEDALSDKEAVRTLAQCLAEEFSPEDLWGQECKAAFYDHLNQIFQMMNDAGVKMNIVTLRDLLSHISTDEIEKNYISNNSTIDVIGAIADVLGVNRDFLAGKTDEHPFKTDAEIATRIELGSDYVNRRVACQNSSGKSLGNISVVFGQDSRGKVERIALVERVNEYKYLYYCNREWYFSKEAGATGKRWVKETYTLMECLENRGKLTENEYIVSENQFAALQNGDIYPKTLIEGIPWNRNTFDCLTQSIRHRDGDDVKRWNENYESQFPGVRDIILEP